jgi:hypothetical protein
MDKLEQGTIIHDLIIEVRADLEASTSTDQLLYMAGVLLDGGKLPPEMEAALRDLVAYARVLAA